MNKDESLGLFFWLVYSFMAFTLFIVFLILKLCGVIAWSWWVVALPLWAFPAAFTAFIALVLVIYGVCAVVRKMQLNAIQRKLNNGK